MPHLLSSLTANLLMNNPGRNFWPWDRERGREDVQIENVPESPCRGGRRARRQVMKGADWQRGLTITFPLHTR